MTTSRRIEPETLPDFPQDPELAALVRETFDWICRWKSPTDARVAGLSIVGTVYAWFCAPTDPTPAQLSAAARFTLLFLFIDDAETSELGGLVDGALTDGPLAVGAEGVAPRMGALSAPMRAWLSEVPEVARASSSLVARLQRTYHEYVVARRGEASARPTTLEEQWALRRRTIFMDPYLDHWMILRGLSADVLGRADIEELRARAVDIVLLSNDLGSLARDRADGASPDDLNLVVSTAAARGLSMETAIDDAVREQHRWVTSLREDVAARAGTDASPYLDLLVGVTDGNLRSLRALRARYPGVDEVIARLALVQRRPGDP